MTEPRDDAPPDRGIGDPMDSPGAPGEVHGDPESGLAEPIPTTAEAATPAGPEGAALHDRAAATSAPGWALALGAVLPGAGHLFVGAAGRGMALLIAWGALLGSGWAGWPVIRHIGSGTLQDWVALLALLVGLGAVWEWAFRDLKRIGRPRGRRGDSQWAIAARQFRKNQLAVVGVWLIFVLYLVALLAPFLAPFDPTRQQNLITSSFLGPSWEHWFGTDRFGRDVLSRVIFGARISLAIGFIAVAISVTLGTLIGAVAGYIGGWVDTVLMRLTDMVLAFPRLVLLIMIVALFTPSTTLIILVLGLTQWPGTTRIVRGEVLSLREREYVQAAKALGMGRARIILRHLVPNVLAPVIVTATLGIGNTIVLEAGLSFLGLGVQPPTASWGNMVADGRQSLTNAWWVATMPGLAIVLTVLAFNLVGDGLRDALDPRLRE